MKTRISGLLVWLLMAAVPLQAADTAPADAPGDVPGAAAERSDAELDELLGPVALYPDALIALILPASTLSSDIVLAARFLEAGGDAAEIDAQPWDDSVKALAHYPDVVRWMDENLQWTIQLGQAVDSQSDAVMRAVQRLRARARAAGTLDDTPQQQVLVEGDVISIVPAQPDVIYVPYYDPEIVYVERTVYYPDPFITFGVGWAVGSWLSFDCDWNHRRIWHYDRHYRWHDRHDWRRPVFPGHPGFVDDPHRRPWRPPHRYQPPRHRPDRPPHTIVRPSPIDRPGRDHDWRRPDRDGPPPRHAAQPRDAGGRRQVGVAPSSPTGGTVDSPPARRDNGRRDTDRRRPGFDPRPRGTPPQVGSAAPGQPVPQVEPRRPAPPQAGAQRAVSRPPQVGVTRPPPPRPAASPPPAQRAAPSAPAPSPRQIWRRAPGGPPPSAPAPVARNAAPPQRAVAPPPPVRAQAQQPSPPPANRKSGQRPDER